MQRGQSQDPFSSILWQDKRKMAKIEYWRFSEHQETIFFFYYEGDWTLD